MGEHGSTKDGDSVAATVSSVRWVWSQKAGQYLLSSPAGMEMRALPPVPTEELSWTTGTIGAHGPVSNLPQIELRAKVR